MNPLLHGLPMDLKRKVTRLFVFDLGGGTFDVLGNFKSGEGTDLLKDKQALQHLTETAEKSKMELSSLFHTISLPFITATAEGPKHIESTLTRAKFEVLCSNLLDRLKIPVQNSVRVAKAVLH